MRALRRQPLRRAASRVVSHEPRATTRAQEQGAGGYWLLVSAAVIACDQLTKAWVDRRCRAGEERALTSFFSLVLAFNTGAAFSFLADAAGWQRCFFAGLAVAAAALIIVWLLRRGGDRIYCAGVGLILGGALGNLCDRVTLGKVVDFLRARYLPFRWQHRCALDPFPAFNVADSAHHRRRRAADPRQLSPARGADRPANDVEPMDEVILANPRGFCAGVDRAIAIVEQALAQFGAPIYVRHEVVHNKFVVDDLRAKGAVFVEELDDVPAGARSSSARTASRARCAPKPQTRGLDVFDATCPLVTKVHVEVAKMRAQGREIVMIGHAGHPEVEGTMGQSDGGIYLVESVDDVGALESSAIPTQLAYVTQTTLSVDDAAAIVAALKRALSGDRRPEEGRHLLRDAESPGRGQVHGAASATW